MFKKLVLTALVVALSLSGAALAVDYTWLGTVSEDWQTAGNWSPSAVPAATGDAAYIDGDLYTVGANNPNVTTTTTAPTVDVRDGGVLTVTAGNGGETPVYEFTTSAGQYWWIHYGGVMNVYGGAQNSNNVYVGTGEGTGVTGTLNIYEGARVNMSGGTLTVGGHSSGSASQTGVINIWGHFSAGNFRWNWNSTGDGSMTLYKDGIFSCAGGAATRDVLQGLIDSGKIVNGTPGYPIQVALDLETDRSTLSCYKSLVAYWPTYDPALVPGPTGTTTAQLNAENGTIELSWTNPLPTGSGEPNAVQSNVYFGEAGGGLSMVAGPNTLDTAVIVNIAKSKNYEWRVDSWDPNMADNDANYVGMTGNVWAFNTLNVRPTAAPTTDRAQVWVGSTTAQLTANAADDGYPLTPGALSYSWANTGDNAVTYTPDNTAQNPQITIGNDAGTSNQNYVFTVTVSDGEYTGTGEVTVRLNDNACSAAKSAGTVVDTGDINADCVTNFIDVATVAAAWLDCNTSDGICPF